ncbi:hypothetical protein [Jeongeupia sp. USM3]|uniref:hypothetical protein n=1 Tax=Jeongeupia sp. USM3 TaxID=1906741 RepID=UPI00089DF541|nr:hypothetical protein [Jeongeupia sp. USM3]AOY00345.1 hypothetical protein BJP62_07735 [Jeongeupia sp. USM3]
MMVLAALLAGPALATNNDAWKATAGVARDACAAAARSAGYKQLKFPSPYQASSGGVSWFFSGLKKGESERQPLYCRYDGMRSRVEALLAYSADFTPD